MAAAAAAATDRFSLLSDDMVVSIFFKLDSEPRVWASLACVSTRFAALVRNVCCKVKCSSSIPSLVSELLHSGGHHRSRPPGGWAFLHKLSVCCPGLHHAGVLLENSDFGLERELGPDEDYRRTDAAGPVVPSPDHSPARISPTIDPVVPQADCGWSLFDDLYFDTVYDVSEADLVFNVETEEPETAAAAVAVTTNGSFELSRKRRRNCNAEAGPHLAAQGWSPSREQGSRLLAGRFKEDCLYICDWPGCLHAEEDRDYMLFRGLFRDFKRSRVWRTINDGSSRSRVGPGCAFCNCGQTWDLQSAFCLRTAFGYHDDGEPVVRAYVCENGHVSGAWTETPHCD